jgi:peroxiredoxin
MVAVQKDSAPAAVAPLTVLDTQGRAVTLGSLGRGGSVVLVFVRHFGCLFCKEQVADVRARLGELHGRGASVVIVGNGSVDDARVFAAEHAAGMTVVTDPNREAYCAVGMKRGVGTALSFGVARRAARAMARGFRQTRTQGDPFQQGGIVVVGADGDVLYRFVSDEAGEHPSLDDVLAALPHASPAAGRALP